MTTNDDARAVARTKILELVKQFKDNSAHYKDAKKFDEAKTRVGFIDPFFEALGWDLKAGQRLIGKAREVIIEDRAGHGNRRRPDYGFYIDGQLQFYVEAKQPSKDLANDNDSAFQLKSYVWSERGRLGILTDFEEFIVFHGAFKPRREKREMGRVTQLCMTYEEYEKNFDLIYDTFSRPAVESGSLDRLLAQTLASNVRQKNQLERDIFKARGAKSVDQDFLEALSSWREELAKELARRNSFQDGPTLTEAVQRFLDRLVFTRIAEDRGIERSNTLMRTLETWRAAEAPGSLYKALNDLFVALAPQFNGVLFSSHPLSETAVFNDDKLLEKIITDLYFPESSYRFDQFPVEVLGAVYEQFLGSVVRVTESGKRAKVELKPEVRHAGGVYYTPRYVVDAIVQKTLAPLLKDATPPKALKIRVLDPACGSGSFLLGAYKYLLEWHLRYYAKSENPAKSFPGDCYLDADGGLHLSLRKKREILTSCIYGVDIDPQATEVAQMSLYLALLDEEAEETIALQRSMELFKADRYLPDLSRNIRCGNSLLGTEALPSDLSMDDSRRINPFDWKSVEYGFGALLADGGFDAIIGNPPYIRIQVMQEWAALEASLFKERYASAKSGNFDIYVLFVEKCLDLLSERGRLGFILPHKFFQAKYGENLRSLIAERSSLVEVVDFGDQQVFDGATTYTCLLFASRKAQPEFVIRHVPPGPDLSKALRAALLAPPEREPSTRLAEKTWDFRSQRGRDVERFLSLGTPLSTVASRIFQGLITGADDVFFLTVKPSGELYSRELEAEVTIEPELVHPLMKGSLHIRRYAFDKSDLVALFPYAADGEGAQLIPPPIFTAGIT